LVASFNRVILVGNLTRDPELKYLQSGTAVCDIGLAVNDRVKKGDQYVDEVSFVDLSAFGRTAEVINEYLTKGSQALFEGRLKQERWQVQDGGNRSKIKIIVDRMQMLGSKGDRSTTTTEGYQPEPPDDGNQDHGDDSIPF
jgi:single-strand DNA-binding protein